MSNEEKNYLYSVSTGFVKPGSPEADSLLAFARGQGGLESVHVRDEGILWLYDSLNNAKVARNIIEASGTKCGANICRFKINGRELVYEDVEA